MKPTLEELEQKEEERKKEQKRVQLAISLDICPVCSSSIIRQDYEKYDKPKGWWIFKTYGYEWDHRKICMKDPLHYEDKKDYYDPY
jgi:hypothetical protein